MSYVRMARGASNQHGVVTRPDARRVGLTDEQVDRCIAEGLLVPLHRGVFRHAAHPFTDDTRLLGAVRASGGFASHRSAARLHGLRDVPRFRPEVSVLQRHLPRLTGVLVHRTSKLGRPDLAEVRGVPCVAVATCLLQLGAVLPPAMVAQAAQDAMIRNLVDELDLVCVLERLGGHGRRGTAALRMALGGAAPSGLDSQLELRLYRLVQACMSEEPVLQHPVRLPDGSLAKLDFAWPSRMLTVEADGRRWHATTADFERGLVRSRALASLGWDRFPFGWADVHQRRDEVRAELRALDVRAA